MHKRTGYQMATTSQPCTKCNSLRTEQRALFTGMYTHCLSCDEPRRMTVHKNNTYGVTVVDVSKVPAKTGPAHDANVGDIVFAGGTRGYHVGATFTDSTNNLHWDEGSELRCHKGTFRCVVKLIEEDMDYKVKHAGKYRRFNCKVITSNRR